MLVRCSNCQTQFSLDDRQVGPDGAAVRCSVCAYVFRVRSQERVPWTVRTVEGETFTAPDLPTIRKWTAEGRLHPDDRVSRTGKHWISLGDMPEFADAFVGFARLSGVVSRPDEPLQAIGPPPDFSRVPSADEPFAESLATERDDDDDGFDSEQTTRADRSAVPIADPPGEAAQHREASPAQALDPRSRPAAAPSPIRREASRPLPLRSARAGAAAPLRPVPAATSMLRAVTERITTPTEMRPAVSVQVAVEPPADEPSAAAPEVADPHPRERAEAWAADPGDDARDARRDTLPGEPDPELEAEPRRSAPARRAWWPWVAGGAVVLLAGTWVAVQVGRGPDEAPPAVEPVASAVPPVADAPELEPAAAALRSGSGLDAAALALEGRLLAPDLPADARAKVRLALVEVLAQRALLGRARAELQPEQAQGLRFRAKDDAERAGRLFAGTQVEGLPAERVAEVRARLRAAQERPWAELQTLLPEGASVELQRTLELAPWLGPDRAGPPRERVEALAEVPELSAAGALLLAAVWSKLGEPARAREAVARVRAREPQHAIAAEIAASLPPPEAVADAEPEEREEEARPARKLSTDELIERGCSAVDAGRFAEAVPWLVDAFDRRPKDVDVLTCLGTAHLRLGRPDIALRYLDKAVARSPRFVPALRATAEAAGRNGDPSRARALYERLLRIEPDDAAARRFVESHPTSE